MIWGQLRKLKNPFAASTVLLLTLCISQTAIAQYTINSVAGGGPNNLPALQSSIGFAQSVALDSAGNIYIADVYANRIFEVSGGTLTVIAGNGTAGYTGDGGPATDAAFGIFGPEGVFVDNSGNIYVADTYNSVIRAVNTGSAPVTIAGVVIQPGNIATVAGNFTAGAGYAGDSGPATSAQLNQPYGVFVDGNGNIFIADTDNNVIREVTGSSGTIQTVAGNFAEGAGYSGDSGPATSAQLDEPEAVFVDASADIFIADTYNSVVREVTSGGNIQTVAGTYYQWNDTCNYSGDGGVATSAQLCAPNGIFVDGSDNIYVADTQNSIVRAVNTSSQPVTIANVTIAPGDIQTIAGTPDTAGFAGDGGAATSAQLNYPGGVAIDGSGDIFIADTFNSVVREVNSAGLISTSAGNNTLAYSGDGGTATNAELNAPGGVFIDSAGNVYIADTNNSAVRVFNPGTQAVTVANVTIQPGDIQTIAGNGIACATPIPQGCGDGGAATSAELNYPYSIFVDGSGNIYIADTGLPLSESSVIRVVNAAGTIQTVVGTMGTAGFAGDGGAPSSAQLYNPQGVFVDANGNIFIADTENSAVRVATGSQSLTIDATVIPANTIQTIAGIPPTACVDASTGCGDNGPANAAYLNFPTGVAVDSAENIYIADSQNSVIRVVNPSAVAVTIAGVSIPAGEILTVAGTLGRFGYSGDNGMPNSATLNTPYGVSVDSLGNIYIADTSNAALREVVAVSALIQTIAGNGTGTAGFSGDGGPATSASLNTPSGVALGSSGIFVADTENSRVRQLISSVAVSVVPATSTLAPSATQQFLANVTGATNPNVTWQVNGVTGGNSTAGTISTLGLYQAPATAPSSAITVTAISDANGVSSGSAQVSIAATGAPAISVSTTPAGVTVVYTSAVQSFTATVTGETNTAVNWAVNGIAGGNSTVGTIDTNGNYTAPSTVPSQPLAIITAVSQADSSISGSYPLTIANVPVAQPPPAQTIGPGETATFSLELSANSGSPQHPITLSCLQSTLPPGATCAFSPATITPSTSAVPFTLAVAVPTGTASLQAGRKSWPAIWLYFGFAPLAGVVLVVGRRRRHGVPLGVVCLFLLALAACSGGNSSTQTQAKTYSIQVQGTTAAQPAAVLITTVTLTVN